MQAGMDFQKYVFLLNPISAQTSKNNRCHNLRNNTTMSGYERRKHETYRKYNHFHRVLVPRGILEIMGKQLGSHVHQEERWYSMVLQRSCFVCQN